MALENQSLATKGIKSQSIPKGPCCLRFVAVLTTASTLWLITGCAAVSKAVVLLQWQVPKGLKVIYVKEMGSELKMVSEFPKSLYNLLEKNFDSF